MFGLNWFVVKATGTASMLGMVQGIGGIVLMVGDIMAGPLVDGYNRKWIMAMSDLISFIACAILATIVNVNNPEFYQLVLLTCIMDIGWAFNYPAAKAIIPEVITPQYLEGFNAYSNTAFNLANVIAPLIGGVLLTISWIDFRTFLWINAGSFLLSLVLTISLRYHPIQNDRPSLSIWESLKEGFQYIWQKKILALLVAIDATVNFFYAGVNLLLPYDVNHYYNGNEKYYSYVLSLLAVGGLIGGLTLVHTHSKVKIQKILIDILSLGIVMIVGGLWISYPVLLVVGALFGFYISRIGVRLMTMVQNRTEIAYLGRVFGIWFLSVDSMQPIGDFVFGFVIDWFKHQTFFILGAILLISVVLIAVILRRHRSAAV
ncbi:hypothetical protein IV38_GL000782 [Lactobacillus selangorensis]|uniref:Major facilitator superfamily (MFS) profile domain-containing protein n=1 Tax=Lactobacillus selangorensis TaxID=81857 RepID=A0A0R2FT23_9LACO|nr:hypothetical protein IV38_GL000782 [Lactobacillus selangorensis]KRN33007.1 hypothetical protein IV40_GL001071 [Lactobacillus selangorensis]